MIAGRKSGIRERASGFGNRRTATLRKAIAFRHNRVMDGERDHMSRTGQAVAAGIRTSGALHWVAAAIAAGFVLGLLGPFGSYLNPGIVIRIFYWIGATLAALAIYGVAIAGAKKLTSARPAMRWPSLAAGIFIASIIHAAASRVVAYNLWPVLRHLQIPLWEWYLQAATVAGLGFALVAANRFRRRMAAPVRPESTSAIVFPGDVIALQMEDHYVRVHTPRGNELVLIPMRKAAEQIGADGLRVHRSWWVAKSAVVSVEGSPRSMRVHLSNGLTAPVARSAVANLRQAGWLASGSMAER